MKVLKLLQFPLFLLIAMALISCSGEENSKAKLANTIVQEHNLDAGWNSISFYVQPESDSISDLVNPILNDFIRMESAFGVHHGAYSLMSKQNSLGAFKPNQGYLLHVENPSILNVTGVKDITDSIYLDDVMKNRDGNYAGYFAIPGNRSLGAEDLQFEDGVDLIFIHNLRGGTYWPENNINNIGLLEPGLSYLFVFKKAGWMTAKVPDNTIPIELKAEEIFHSPLLPREWSVASFNPFLSVLLIPNNLLPKPFDGDFLAAFTPDGVCAGLEVVRVEDEYSLLSIYAFDAYAREINGFKQGEPIEIDYFHTSDSVSQRFHVYYEKDTTQIATFIDWGGNKVVKMLEINSK